MIEESSELSNHKGEKIHLVHKKLVKNGQNLIMSISKLEERLYELEQGEIVSVDLIRSGIKFPKSRRRGSPLLRKDTVT